MKDSNIMNKKHVAEESFAAIVGQIPVSPGERDPLSELERSVEKFLQSNITYQMMAIPLHLVETDENVRLSEDEENDPEFRSLVASIQKLGVLQPATLRVVEDPDGLRFKCVAGHRRIKAARVAIPSLQAMKFIVRKFENDNLQLISTVIENTHRKSLHPFDLAFATRKLLKQGMTFAEMEVLFERNQWNLRRYDKMNDWSESTRKLVVDNSKKFAPSFLLHLASRALSPQEVDLEIRKKVGLAVENNRKPRLADRVKEYATESLLTEEQTALITKALVDLGFLKNPTKRGGGRRKGASAADTADATAQ